MLTKNQIIDLYFMGYSVKDIVNRAWEDEKAVPTSPKLQKQHIREIVETALIDIKWN
jgi:hypothetical protein